MIDLGQVFSSCLMQVLLMMSCSAVAISLGRSVSSLVLGSKLTFECKQFSKMLDTGQLK